MMGRKWVHALFPHAREVTELVRLEVSRQSRERKGVNTFGGRVVGLGGYNVLLLGNRIHMSDFSDEFFLCMWLSAV